MTEAAKHLAMVDFSEDRNIWLDEIYSISSGNSYDIVVRNNETVIFSSSIDIGIKESPDEFIGPSFENPELIQKPRDPFRPVTSEMEWEETGENIFVGYSTDPRNNNEFILCTTQNDDGLSIFLTQPIEPIDASIGQSNLLLIVCTAGMLVISILFSLRFSRGFTRPIKEIKGRVEQISNLDFTGKLNISTGDELESLGADVNELANKLHDTLDELKEKNLQLERDIIAQRSFISNASHELRTPLSLIKGYADELNSGFSFDENAKNTYLKIISDESTKLNRLLNEMLDLSRLESGRMELNKEKIQMNEFIESFIEKYSGFIKEKGIDVEMELCNDSSCVHDVMRVEQILANYLSNAAKYSDERKKVVISTKIIDDNVRISVFNYGKGIDEKSIDRIWDGFYKADNARTRNDDSYGLGLSIVKAIQTIAKQSYGAENHDDGVEFWFDAKLN
jgi:signal transduction histidine kinase